MATRPAARMSLGDRARQTAVLSAVQAQVIALHRAGRRPVVVFDLDNTLFDPTVRATRILRWLGHREGVAVLERFTYRGENAADLFRIVGAEVEDRAKLARMGKRFARLYDRLGAAGSLDRLAPGAVSYVNALREMGATVVYLTGRGEGERERTLATLQRAGLPTSVDTRLLMRPESITDVQAYKRSAVPSLLGLGQVVASFDDDPANCRLMSTQLRGAQIVHVQLHPRPGSAALPARVDRIRDFNGPPSVLRALGRWLGRR